MADVRFRVDMGSLLADLRAMGAEVEDLKDAFSAIAKKGAALAASFAPRRTGRLQATVRGNRAKSKAVVRAGGARARYAPVINWGWPARNIEPALFMQRADRELGPEAPRMLEDNIREILRRRNLT